jgi:hypothetical protein
MKKNIDKKALYEKIMSAIIPEVKKAIDEDWRQWLKNDPGQAREDDFDTLYTDLMDVINGRIIDFVKADGEGVTLDTVVDNKPLRIDVIYPDGTADTNAGKIDLEDTIADEDDLTLLIDLVNDYSEDFVEDLDESVNIDSDEDDDLDEDMPHTVTFWDHNYGEICATRCFNPDYNTDKSYWECADEDGTVLCELWTDTFDADELSIEFEKEMEMHDDDLWYQHRGFDDEDDDEDDLEDEDDFEDYEYQEV